MKKKIDNDHFGKKNNYKKKEKNHTGKHYSNP